jgi:RHS repeat-associated protein
LTTAHQPSIVRAYALTISSDRFAHGSLVAMKVVRVNTAGASFTRRHLPPRCSRITSSRPNRMSNVPRTFDMHSFNGMPIATLRPKGANSGTPLGIAGTTTGNPANGATAANANNVGNNTTTNRVNVEVFYVHADHLGTPRVVTRSTVATGANAPSSATPTSPGAINKAVWMWNSDPFGTTGATGAGGSANSAPTKNPQLVTGTAAQIAAATFEQNLRMPGQFEDAETKSFYNYFKDLDPFTGRYIQSDPIGLKAGFATFGYGFQSPIRNRDKFGLFSWSDVERAWTHYCEGSGTPWFTNFDSINWGGIDERAKRVINQRLKSEKCADKSITIRETFGGQAAGADRAIVGRHSILLSGTANLACDCNWTFNGNLSSALGRDPFDFDASNRGFWGEAATWVGRNRCPEPSLVFPNGPSSFDIHLLGYRPISLSRKCGNG